ncbi:MAG: hypothetical protein ACI841_003602 [Planctomycetota bacterium]|jgi:hypothetical protein
MLRQVLIPLSLTLCLPIDPVATDYSIERTLEITRESTIESVTETEILIDGEPMEGRGGGSGGREYMEDKSVVTRDTVIEHDEGTPTHVRREFKEVAISGSSGSGENSREIERPCTFDGVILDLTLDEDGELEIEQVDGDEVDEDALVGHSLKLTLDMLLPEDEVEEGDSWEIGSDDAKRLLALGLDSHLFGQTESEGRGGEGGGRGGGRGGRGGRGGGPERMLSQAEWECEATLVSESVMVDELECMKIKVVLEAEGELEEMGGGRGRDRFEEFESQFAAAFGPSNTPITIANDYSLELSGHFLFSIKEKRPVSLELEGTMISMRSMERDRDGSTMEINSSQEGEMSYSITVEALEREVDETETSEKD